LGLSISQKFVQLLGGDIQVKSQIGKGTTFTFSIQAALVDEATFVAQHVAYSKRPLALEPNQPHYRILIVDDHPHNRRMLVKLLSASSSPSDRPSIEFETGFELREARNGLEAFEIWKEWQPHLIWLDLRMPGMDGYEVTERIRKKEKEQQLRTAENNAEEHVLPHTLIIMLSASSFEDERETALARGCDDFLRKPFHETEMFELMHRHLGVRFVYEDDEKPATAITTHTLANVISPEALAALPEELRKNLRDAIDVLDTTRVMSLLGHLRQQNKPLADSLEDLVAEYRFDLLQDLFE
jgi:CheY-like chemotaxis protein